MPFKGITSAPHARYSPNKFRGGPETVGRFNAKIAPGETRHPTEEVTGGTRQAIAAVPNPTMQAKLNSFADKN
jgi:hypothetical protein